MTKSNSDLAGIEFVGILFMIRAATALFLLESPEMVGFPFVDPLFAQMIMSMSRGMSGSDRELFTTSSASSTTTSQEFDCSRPLVTRPNCALGWRGALGWRLLDDAYARDRPVFRSWTALNGRGETVLRRLADDL